MLWKAIAIIALTLGLEAGFLLNAAVPPQVRPDAQAQMAGQPPPAGGFALAPSHAPRPRS